VISVLVRLAVAASVLPVPIGVGPHYHPAAGVHRACRAGSLAAGSRMHLELFARRRVVVVPTAIGVRGAQIRFGRVVAARCRTRIWTTDPSGVVRYTGTASLGDVFRTWGEPLGRDRLLGFGGRVRVYRNGDRVAGAPGGLRLRDGDEVVLEVGGYVPPHRGFRFPR